MVSVEIVTDLIVKWKLTSKDFLGIRTLRVRKQHKLAVLARKLTLKRGE